jgi:predicted ATPase/DNA-binding XRE family transcriptional regulator
MMDAVDAPPFAALLRRYRLAAGLSQEELAERAGLSAQAISALERGVRRAPYRDTIDLLAAALGLAAADRDLLAASVARARRPQAAGPAPPGLARGDLPLPTTSFVGRAQEQATVLRLLESSRLLTLTGAGGVGKTRLALQVAATLGDRYADGVRQVELAAVADPTFVPHAVAQAVGVQELSDGSIGESLANTLRGKALLLLLDNCEHVRATVGELATVLLRACPGLRILTTSREALAVVGETVWRVPPMAVAGAGSWEPGAGVAPPSGVPGPAPSTRHPAPDLPDAVRLFVERATAVQAGFVLTDANAAAVAEICRRLDGIPLALELAAAWVPVLSPEQIVARLEDRFRLLTARVGVPARHQTLRASLDWSYDLLSAPERGLMERLAAFVGGCSLEAVEGVCAAMGNGRSAIEDELTIADRPSPIAADVLDLLAKLVQKSLVMVEGESTPRYRLLETVRQYVADRATEADRIAARDAHLRWYVLLAERAERHLFRAGREQWLKDLDAELANIRVALEWAVSAARPEPGMCLVGALHGFWLYRSHLSEGRRWAERLLVLPTDADRTAARAKALAVAGIYAWTLGSQENAWRRVEESVAVWRAVGNPHGLAFSLGQLAVAHRDPAVVQSSFAESRQIFTALGETESIALSLFLEGYVRYRGLADVASGAALIEEARRLFRAQNDRLNLANCAYLLGEIAFYQGDMERSQSLFEESLPLLREVDDKRQSALALSYLGRIADHLGDTDRALALLDKAQAIRYERGDAGAISQGLAIQAVILMRSGQFQRAAALMAESLALERSRNSPSGIARILEGIATIAVAQGHPRRAATIFGAAQALREASGDAVTPTWRALYDRAVASARTALGEDAFATAWTTGHALSLDAAIGEALEQVAATTS